MLFGGLVGPVAGPVHDLNRWQMGTLRLESVLVGDVVDGVHLTIITGERVRATDDQGLHIIAQLLQLRLLLALVAIAGLEAVERRTRFFLKNTAVCFVGREIERSTLIWVWSRSTTTTGCSMVPPGDARSADDKMIKQTLTPSRSSNRECNRSYNEQTNREPRAQLVQI